MSEEDMKPRNTYVHYQCSTGANIHMRGGKYFALCLENAFGKLPILLGKKHIKVLKGFRACGFPDVYGLIREIKSSGKTKVFKVEV